jgi:hypothetical protein
VAEKQRQYLFGNIDIAYCLMIQPSQSVASAFACFFAHAQVLLPQRLMV